MYSSMFSLDSGSAISFQPVSLAGPFCSGEELNGSDDAEIERLLQLFDNHADVIKALLLRIVGCEEEAEDLLTETFTAALTQISRLDVEPLPALIEIARQRGLEWMRTNGLPVPVETSTGMESLTEGSSLGNLPAMQRRVVEHIYFEGGSISSFAREMNAPREWVYTALTHALSTIWKHGRNKEIELVGARET